MLSNVVAALNARGFKCTLFDNAAQAKQEALRIIGTRSVGFGGSKTVSDMNLYEELKAKGNAVHWHWKAPAEDKDEQLTLASRAEVYVCSSNAIVEDGRLINIDGTGNRVANLCFGPRCVIIIAGVNKICPSYDSAIERIKRDACPPNAVRLKLNTPCALSGVCQDCKSKARMCNVTVVSEYPTRLQDEFYVLLVNEKLGL